MGKVILVISIIFSVCVISVVLFIAIAFWIAYSQNNVVLESPQSPQMANQPNFRATVARCDDSCSRLTNYCLRLICDVTNHGNGDGIANVEGRFRSSQGRNVSQNRSIHLNPYQSQEVEFHFYESRLRDTGEICYCSAQ